MNIFEVAKACNVSKSTVSRVLNNHPHVNEEKRERILRFIEENNYVPNNIATYLKNRTTKSIAISIPYIDHPFFSQVSYELSKNFNSKGYKSFVHQTFCSPSKEEEIFISLQRNEIDAVILCSVENDSKVIEEYADFGLIISSNDAQQTEYISNFHFDEFNIGKMATEYLLNRNIKKIGMCMDNPFNRAQILRLDGYKKSLSEKGIAFNKNYIFSSAFAINDGIKIGEKIKSMYPELEGLYTGNDYVSAGVQKVLGSDVILIGTDNHAICQITNPKLSSISLPIIKMAEDICTHTINCLVNKKKIIINKLYEARIITN
ncbi:LacI family DNA-binding transcriptional regulator [Staphylococcus kloosii]|jgi:DNA-binding LacI/PurR family transcriptional regulator|uniref:LacI family DNA-binding transcriptional regulator n=1 Tax=Staphylococcus kloosii TaxID=29384 RepID=UPI00189FED0B|nr:LacI family DNA-binding transcriptional regulator [Staphylococcus kloosii]MBF7030107.1 LacI family DNA-binding transcriptional regulator [Staphylococcus kloosii]